MQNSIKDSHRILTAHEIEMLILNVNLNTLCCKYICVDINHFVSHKDCIVIICWMVAFILVINLYLLFKQRFKSELNNEDQRIKGYNNTIVA